MAKPLLDDALPPSPVKRPVIQAGGSRGQPPRGQKLPFARLSGGTVSASARRTIWFVLAPKVLAPILLVAVLGLLTLGGIWSLLTPKQYDMPTQLASVPLPLPRGPCSLAWSADGSYVAAGSLGPPGEVFVVDVAKACVLTTLELESGIEALAFSPDGKWLAAGTRPTIIPAGTAPVELVVFDVPAFTARFTAKSASAETGFIDLAWAPDSKALHAIDGPPDNAPGKSEVRRWDMPAFTEQPANRAPQQGRPVALAVSPDGRTLALGEQQGPGNTSVVIRLFDLGKRAEQLSFRIDKSYQPPRLGFTADGKAVGVYDSLRLSWWDVGTGRPREPSAARFTVQPAGLSHIRCYNSVSPDGAWVAWGYERHRGFGDLGWDFRDKEFGAFVKVAESATAKTQTWRVSNPQYAPPVAFSPDGTRLAGAVTQPQPSSPDGTNLSILIWAVPK